MTTSPAEPKVWTIGRWRFDAASGSLNDGVNTQRLEHRTAATLAMLCRRRGGIVSRQELLDEVWQGRAVSANSVAVVIADIRRSLDDDAKAPTHLLTLAKRGYQLMPPSAHETTKPVSSRRRSWWAIAGAGVLTTSVVALLCLVERPGGAAPTLVVGAVRNGTGLAQDAGLATSLQALLIDQLAHERAITVVQEGVAPRPTGAAQLILSAKLVLWNGLPTIHMVVTESATGRVIWSGMAVAEADRIASATIHRLAELKEMLRSPRRPIQ